MVVFIIIVVAVILYFSFSSKQQPSSISQHPNFKNLVGEDKLKIEITFAIEKVVETSLKISKQNGHSEEISNVFLISDINAFKERLSSNVFVLASQYKVSSDVVLKSIDTMCEGAILTYVFKL